MRKARSIHRTLLVAMTLLATLSTLVVGCLWIWQEYATFRTRAQNIRTELTEERKALIKSRVDNAVEYIEFKRLQADARTREIIRERTEEAHELATHLYEQYKAKVSLDETKDIVREALRPIRYDNGRGYYFASALDGVEQLFADRPEMEGLNLLDMQDTRGAYVIRDMIEIVKGQGEGYYTYTWTKPDNPGGDFLKISYAKLFEPFDWFIGTGEYLDDVEENLKKEALEWVGNIRYDDGGYVFVGTWEGLSLSGPMVGQNMIDTVDPDGIWVVRELIAKSKEGGGFVSYVMPGFRGYRSAPKISYVTAVRDWEWYVGTGAYLDDIERTVAAARDRLAVRVRLVVKKILAIVALLLFASYLISRRIARGINSQFAAFSDFFDEAARESTQMSPEGFKYSEFQNLARAANHMTLERRRAEEAKAHLTDQLLHSQKLEAVGRLAGGIAHDFNNLLQVILGYMEMAAPGIPEDGPARTYLAEAKKGAERAASLTRQLLAFSRRQPFQPEPVDITGLLSSVSSMLRRTIGEHIELVVHAEAATRPVMADRGQIEQVLMNLVINARDAMRDGGKLTIGAANFEPDDEFRRAHGDADGRYVVLRISDTGEGIPESAREHIFEPFFTTKEVGSGTGLGLAVVYAIISRHGGMIEWSSLPGKGTVFNIFLPAATTAIIERTRPAQEPARAGSGELILVAEDDQAVRRLTVMLLEGAGYRTLVAADGEEALDLVSRHAEEIDLAVLDVVMPRKGGKEVHEALVAVSPSVPVLFTSGYSDAIHGAAQTARAPFFVIQKPYSSQEMLTRVRQLLDERAGGS